MESEDYPETTFSGLSGSISSTISSDEILPIVNRSATSPAIVRARRAHTIGVSKDSENPTVELPNTGPAMSERHMSESATPAVELQKLLHLKEGAGGAAESSMPGEERPRTMK